MASFVFVVLFFLSLPLTHPFRSSETADYRVFSPGTFGRRYGEYGNLGCGAVACVISASCVGIGLVAVKFHALRATLVVSDPQSLSGDQLDQWHTSVKLLSSLPKELVVGCEAANGSFLPYSKNPRCLPARWLRDNIVRIGHFTENPFLDQHIGRHLAALRELGPEFPLVNVMDFWIEPILLHDISSGVYELLLGFMAMEHFAGGDLEGNPPLPSEAVQILLLLMGTVIEMHLKGLHHGDIHPGNVLCKRFSEFGPRVCVLSDFGWSSFQNMSYWGELHRFESPPVHDALQLCKMTNEFLRECPSFSESLIGRYCDPLDPKGMKSELQAKFDLMRPNISFTAHNASARALQKASRLLLQFAEESLGFELAYVFDSRLRRDLLGWKRDLTNLMEEMKGKHSTEMEELKTNHAVAMEALKKDHAIAMEALKKDHAIAMEALKNDHAVAMEALKNDHAVAMEALKRDHTVAMEALKKDHEALKKAHEALKKDHAVAMEALKKDHAAALEAFEIRLTKKHRGEMDDMNSRLKALENVVNQRLEQSGSDEL